MCNSLQSRGRFVCNENVLTGINIFTGQHPQVPCDGIVLERDSGDLVSSADVIFRLACGDGHRLLGTSQMEIRSLDSWLKWVTSIQLKVC